LLRGALQATGPAGSRLAPRAWLGEAVAIKDPAAAVFARRSGANLLLVGQDEQAALGVLANALISLAAELPQDWPGVEGETPHPQLMILDGQRAESPLAGFWSRLAAQLAVPVRVVTAQDVAATIATVAEEVQRRLAAAEDAAPPIFLFVFNLPRFRDLRRSDDYSFSFDESAAAVSPDKQFATILREGPNYGVHMLVWCDTHTNVSRWVDRSSLNDLAWRVLFQMSATDSANLMESPEASRLGLHRAVLYNEEQGDFEKFRPYAIPTADWLTWVRDQLARRARAASPQPQ
jgi:hypothetical protein